MPIKKASYIILRNILLVILISIIIALYLSLSHYIFHQPPPDIKAYVSIHHLTDEDFDQIGTPNVVKEDFRKVNFSLYLNHFSTITQRDISIPNLKEIMNIYDIERYWYGNSTYSDNPGEDAYYLYDIMFLSKGLNEEEIKSVFKDHQIEITWTDEDGLAVNTIINLADIIKFE